MYVASRRVSSGGSPNVPFGYYNSMNFPASSSGPPRDFRVLKPQDEEVIGFLQKNGIAFEIVDLSKTTYVKRLVSKISRMRTPTLITKDRKLVGLESIRKAVEEKYAPQNHAK